MNEFPESLERSLRSRFIFSLKSCKVLLIISESPITKGKGGKGRDRDGRDRDGGS